MLKEFRLQISRLIYKILRRNFSYEM